MPPPRLLYLIFIILILGTMEKVVDTACKLEMTGEVEHVEEAADLMLGGVVQFYTTIQTKQQMDFLENLESVICGSPFLPFWRHLLVFIFAIEEINSRSDILPNITLGYNIYDSCMIEHKAVQSALSILSGGEEAVPNYSCEEKNKVVAFIGHMTSSSSLSIAEIIGLYGYPQISYGAMDSIFNNKLRFPSFYRTVPDGRAQYEAIVLMLKHFGWNWVGILRAEDESSQRSGMELNSMMAQNGICVAFQTVAGHDVTKYMLIQNDYNHFIYKLLRTSCNIIIFIGNSLDLRLVQSTIFKHLKERKVFILPSSFIEWNMEDVDKFPGSLQISLHRRNIPGLKDYLLSVGPYRHPDSTITSDVWIQHLYRFDDTSRLSPSVSCNHTDISRRVAPSKYDVNNFRYTFSVYSAVYAVAHALHDLSVREGKPKISAKNCSRMLAKVNRYMKKVNFTTPGGETLYFDDKGNPPTRFDVVNYYTWNATKGIRPVGYFHDVDGRVEMMINDSDVRWDTKFTETPQSVCSPSCLHGYRKVLNKGRQKCCFYCVPCPEGEISNQTDMETCLQCSENQWSNKRRDSCIPKTMDFLSYEEALGSSLVLIALLFCLLTALILGIFIKYKDTAIVKANNQNLSFILLLSLLFSFLCPYLFIGRPTETSCLLRQVVFGTIFTVAVSSLLVKTITVVLAFKATKPDTIMKRWLGKHFSACFLVIFSSVEVVICVFWLSFSPPFLRYNIKIEIGKIVLQCDEGSIAAFYIALGYVGFLAVLSFIVAFLARKLPDTFNEAQYITFSMLVFCSVWISFIPAYLSTKGKYMVAAEVFAIEISGAGLLCCIFIPKCYIILRRPELNVKSNLVHKKKHKIAI